MNPNPKGGFRFGKISKEVFSFHIGIHLSDFVFNFSITSLFLTGTLTPVGNLYTVEKFYNNQTR